MKTISSFLFMLLITSASIASPDFVLKSVGKSIIINSSGLSTPDYLITIKDVLGQVVFNKEYFSPAKTNNVKLNVDQLPEGEYEIELSNDFKIQKQTFIKNALSILVTKDVKTIFKPIVKTDGAIIKVNFLNLDNRSSIEILDPANHVIYASEITQLQYAKQFNLSTVSPGEYSVHIAQGDRSYWTAVYIK